MKKKLTWGLIFALVLGVLGLAAGTALKYLNGETDIVKAMTDQLSLMLLGVCAVGGFIIGMCTKSDKKALGKTKGTDSEGKETDINFDSHYITGDEMKKDKELIYATWDELPYLNKSGFVFRQKKEGRKFEINMKPETHALVLGTTGTGKTQLFANPTIRILSHTAQKPSIVLTDPKGELYEDNADVLRKEDIELA